MTLFGESEARYAALAGLVHGARVLDLREHSDARCIDALVTAGASSITVCAPDSVRHHLTTQNVELRLVAPLALPLELGSGSFDVVICFDLMARAAADPAWTSALRDVLTPEGALVIAGASAEEAAATLGPTFGNATVFAQSPLVGHMLYDVGVEELEPELDRTWADDGHDEPSSYMVVFAPDERHSEKLTLVQMPFSSWNKVAGAEAETLRAEAETLRAEAETLRAEAETLRAEAETARAERDTLAHELTTAREEIARGAWKQGHDGGDLAAVQNELESARNEIAVLLGELESTRAELDRLSTRVRGAPAELEEELVRHRNDRASLEAQIADLLEESSVMSARRVEWQARLDGVEQEIAAERARVAELTSQAVGAAARGEELEERLRREEARGLALDQETAAERVRATDWESAYAQAQARVAELEAAANRSGEGLQRRIDELQRSLDASRRRGDDLARDLDGERQQLAELRDGLENERLRMEELRQALAEAEARASAPGSTPDTPAEPSDDAQRQTSEAQAALLEAQKGAEEAQEALAEARREGSETAEALRKEQVRNEQLLARLVDLERQLGAPPKEKEMEAPSGGKAVDGES